MIRTIAAKSQLSLPRTSSFRAAVSTMASNDTTAAVATAQAPRAKLSGFEFYKSIGSPVNFVAPMVDQSELPYRLLCRKYGAQVCYTPMFHSRNFGKDKEYRRQNFQPCEADRPLIVQFCGNDAETVLRAAKFVENDCDAVDLNLGCPQGIARKGRYGAFLMHEPEVVRSIVEKLHKELSVPVTCKIRILPSFDDTMAFAKMLVEAGCQLLVVHGRTKEENKLRVGECDWDAISKIKAALPIPVIANGGIFDMDDVERCVAETGVDGVMSSEAVLANPALFSRNICPETNKPVSNIDLSLEYLDLCDKHEVRHPKVIRAHMFKFLSHEVSVHTDLRDKLANGRLTNTVDSFRAVVLDVKHRLEKVPLESGRLDNWYFRHQKKAMEAEKKLAEQAEQKKAELAQKIQQLKSTNNNGEAEQMSPSKKRLKADNMQTQAAE